MSETYPYKASTLIVAFVASFLSCVILDYLVLNKLGVLKAVYRPAIDTVMRKTDEERGKDHEFHYVAAILSWSCVAAFVCLITVLTWKLDFWPRQCITFLSGFLLYAVFDFTLKFIFPSYSWTAIIVDLAWGTCMTYMVHHVVRAVMMSMKE
jgi:uncharacterized membrane protein